jgi:hypothetical protein
VSVFARRMTANPYQSARVSVRLTSEQTQVGPK